MTIAPLTKSHHQFRCLISYYSVGEIWYFLKKSNKNDKNTTFWWKSTKKISNKYTYTCNILCSGLTPSVCGVIILRALGFDMQWRTAREIQFLFFRGLFLVLAGFSFFGVGGGWALGNNAMKWWDFPESFLSRSAIR